MLADPFEFVFASETARLRESENGRNAHIDRAAGRLDCCVNLPVISIRCLRRFASVQKKSSPPEGGEDNFNSLTTPDYGLGEELVVVEVELLVPVPGDEAVVVFEVLDEDEEPPPDGDDLSITVVLLSLFFSPGGLVTVVSFCSQAARKATPNNRQMYFIIPSYSERTR